MAIVALIAAALLGAQAAPSAGFAERSLMIEELKTLRDSKHGDYLADQTGEPLYVFSLDKRDRAGGKKSECFDTCARDWPPGAGSPDVRDGIDKSLLSSFVRKDGQPQLTYNGWPLYYYSVDIGAGSKPSGHGRLDSGGTWYLIRPDGDTAVVER